MNTLKQDRVSISKLGRSLVERPPNSHPVPLLHPLPYERLPTELIQDIFSLACPEAVLNSKGTFVPFHYKLSLVCRKWRDIVAGHRSLWATFEIRAEGEWNPKFDGYLRKYLQHSGTHPLKIVVQVRGGDEGHFNILDAIIPHCERWATIKLDFCLEFHLLQKLESIQDRLPLLQRLRITGPMDRRYPPGTQPLMIFRTAPLLNRVAVNDIDAHSNRVLALPWNRISRASLDSFSFGEVQPSLELSKTLTSLTLVEGYLDTALTTAFLESPATLKTLQVLRVCGKFGVEQLSCPSLKRLEVWHEDGSAIRKLLSNSSCSLVHLELRGLGDGSLSPIIRHKSLASLTFLHLEDNWVNDGAKWDVLILDHRRLLPALEILYVNVDLDPGLSRANKNFKAQIGSLRRVVESRTYDRYGRGLTLPNLNMTPKRTIIMALKECRFTFHAYQEGWDKWQDGALKCLRSFCNSRNVLAVLTGFGVGQENDPCNDIHCIHIEDSDGDDSDNGDYSDYNEDSGDVMT